VNKLRSKCLCSVFVGFLGFACCSAQVDDYDSLLGDMSAQFAKEVTAQYGFFYSGCCGELIEDIKSVDLKFQSYSLYSIDEIRPLVVKLSERYLFMINHDEKIRPYLHTYPFTPKQFSLSLDFVDRNDGLCPEPPNIALVLYVKGKIFYYIGQDKSRGWNPFSKYYVEFYAETIEQASELVGYEKTNFNGNE